MSGARPSTSAASRRRREQIIEAARVLLRESSADKILVADIAEQASVSVATIYNLVGQRDRVLLAVLDHTASTIRDQLKHDEATLGIDRCLAVIATACDAILADPSVHRHALAALGEVSQGQWLDEGLYETIEASIIDAIEQRELGSEVAASSTAVAVQLGFRGALMSWSFGQLNDDELIQTSQLTAALTLAATARPSHRRRLHALASQPSEINDIRQLPTKRSNQ